MARRRGEQDTITYSAGGEWAQALTLLVELARRTVEQDIITYGDAVNGSAQSRAGHLHVQCGGELVQKGLRVGASFLLVEMARRRVEQDTITNGDVVSACEKGGEWAKCQSS
jgi:hypothetical protein